MTAQKRHFGLFLGHLLLLNDLFLEKLDLLLCRSELAEFVRGIWARERIVLVILRRSLLGPGIYEISKQTWVGGGVLIENALRS